MELKNDWIKALPTRQKLLICLAIVIGLGLALGYQTHLLVGKALTTAMFFYSIGLPFCFLFSNAIIDLNNNLIYCIWFTIGTVLFAATFFTQTPDFFIQRNAQVDYSRPENAAMTKYAGSSLKALFCFLIVYWPINKLLNRAGMYVISTAHRMSW
jgi:hypothetical protein